MSDYHPNDEELLGESLSDATDHQILMHRDAHFSGQFPIMIDYYEKEGKGVLPEFPLARIRELANLEMQMNQNLSGLLLDGTEAERVADAKSAYKNLRDIYDIPNPKSKHPQLIADLILSEEEPEAAIAAVVAEKSAIVPALIELIRSEDYYDPLFPGYGQAPALAIECLGKIGDKRAIYSLFEAIGESDFFNEDAILDALQAIGEPAKQFLLKVLHGRPLNNDNERAAIALIRFKNDAEVGQAVLKMLKEPEVRKNIPLGTYLILACEGLPPASKKELEDLAKDPATPSMLKKDLEAVAKVIGKR